MPSLGDVANEVKSLLEDIKANTSTIKSHTNTIKNNTTAIKDDTSVIKTNTNTIINKQNQIDDDMKNGFVNLAEGLNVLIALGSQANQLSAENNEQNRTIICWLTNIANTLCDIKHNTDEEVALQTDLSDTVHHIDDIEELVNAHEAMEVANHNDLEDRINECCPPPIEPIRPCFDQCKSAREIPFRPIKTEWKPVIYNVQKKKPIE